MTFLLFTCAASSEECKRVPRDEVYSKTPINVYVAHEIAEIILPNEKKIEAARADITDGLIVKWSKQQNKIGFVISKDTYSSLLRLEGESGKTYLVNLVTRPACADSIVNITHIQDGTENSSTSDSQSKSGNLKTLMWYLWNDKLPDGYKENSVSSLPFKDRIVFEQNMLKIAIEKKWTGSRYVGTVYKIINMGRNEEHFNIPAINFGDEAVRKSLGIVREISMWPTSQRLSPSPEFVGEAYTNRSHGYLFVVSEIAEH